MTIEGRLVPASFANLIQKPTFRDIWVAQSVKHLPSAWVMIPGFRDQALHQAPYLAGSLLLPLSAHTLPLCLSQIDKQIKS